MCLGTGTSNALPGRDGRGGWTKLVGSFIYDFMSYEQLAVAAGFLMGVPRGIAIDFVALGLRVLRLVVRKAQVG